MAEITRRGRPHALTEQLTWLGEGEMGPSAPQNHLKGTAS